MLEMSGTGARSGPAGATAPARRQARRQASGASARRLRENKKAQLVNRKRHLVTADRPRRDRWRLVRARSRRNQLRCPGSEVATMRRDRRSPSRAREITSAHADRGEPVPTIDRSRLSWLDSERRGTRRVAGTVPSETAGRRPGDHRIEGSRQRRDASTLGSFALQGRPATVHRHENRRLLERGHASSPCRRRRPCAPACACPSGSPACTSRPPRQCP